MQNSLFATGLLPVGVIVDPRGRYMYVSNFNANTVSAYAIDQSTGSPVGSVGSGATPVGTGPTCLTIEPALRNLSVYLEQSRQHDLGSLAGRAHRCLAERSEHSVPRQREH